MARNQFLGSRNIVDAGVHCSGSPLQDWWVYSPNCQQRCNLMAYNWVCLQNCHGLRGTALSNDMPKGQPAPSAWLMRGMKAQSPCLNSRYFWRAFPTLGHPVALAESGCNWVTVQLLPVRLALFPHKQLFLRALPKKPPASKTPFPREPSLRKLYQKWNKDANSNMRFQSLWSGDDL